MNTCPVFGCQKPRAARSRWCAMHTARYYRNGSVDAVRRRGPVPGERCWECGRLAPAGVCTEPHPSYCADDAMARGLVERQDLQDLREVVRRRLALEALRRALRAS